MFAHGLSKHRDTLLQLFSLSGCHLVEQVATGHILFDSCIQLLTLAWAACFSCSEGHYARSDLFTAVGLTPVPCTSPLPVVKKTIWHLWDPYPLPCGMGPGATRLRPLGQTISRLRSFQGIEAGGISVELRGRLSVCVQYIRSDPLTAVGLEPMPMPCSSPPRVAGRAH